MSLRAAAFTLAAMLCAGGCAVLGIFGGGASSFAFSHRQHQELGLECGDCHAGAAEQEDPGMPIAPACNLCHEGIDAEKAPERGIAQLFDADSFRATHRYRLGGDVVFSHLQHVTGGIGCDACHLGIQQSERIADAAPLRMDGCIDCHEQRAAGRECTTCHRTIRVDVAPPSHAFLWRQLHGQTVRRHGDATGDRCSLCHTESTCTSCHSHTPPDNHTSYWRRRAHGLQARMDRENCAACHRSDSCDSCHDTTRPLNHTGRWGAPRADHCTSCHEPLRATECATCHRDAPGHALAPPLPPNHSPAMMCRQCHGAIAPLSHADNGDSCTLCHH